MLTTQERLCIYVAGPLTADTPELRMQNVEAAMRAGLELIRRGHHPLVPHLSEYLDLLAARESGKRFGYWRWMEIDIAWLRRADAMLYLAPSNGADIELQEAHCRDLRIFHSLDEVPVYRCLGPRGHDCPDEVREQRLVCPECGHAWDDIPF